MARILAISNQKGGVGKTTTAINLAAALAQAGRQVLLVDLDPQANATSGVGFPRHLVGEGVHDVLLDVCGVEAVRLVTAIDGLHLLPADRDLVGAEVALAQELARERRLRRALDAVRDAYDWIVVDCPPSLGMLTINGLVAADGVLVPLQAEYYAMEGLSDLLRTIDAVRKHLNPDLEREGILVTLSDPRTNLSREVERQARDTFGDEVFRTVIPRNIRLGEAPSHGLPIVAYEPRSAGARAYGSLAAELLERYDEAPLRAATPFVVREAS